MEEFYEQYNGKDYGKFQEIMNSIEYGALLIAAVYLLGFRAFLTGVIMLLIYVAIVYFNRSKFVAYEYELTQENLVISKVMGEKRRKKLISFDLSNIESVSREILKNKQCKLIKAFFEEDKDITYIYVKTNEGLTCVAVNMNEKMIQMCYRLKPSIFMEVKR